MVWNDVNTKYKIGLNLIKNLLNTKILIIKIQKIRSVLSTFQKKMFLFHANDSGYKFVSEQVAMIDKNNPQVALDWLYPHKIWKLF